MKLTYDQFVDMCILAGCDYAESIKGACHAFTSLRGENVHLLWATFTFLGLQFVYALLIIRYCGNDCVQTDQRAWHARKSPRIT